MYVQTNTPLNRDAVVEYRQFQRQANRGLTRDNLSRFAVDQAGRQFCVDLIVGFLSNITHYLSSAQYGLTSWQPRQVINAADTMWSECITIGAGHAAQLARDLEENAEAGRPRECRRDFALLRGELIFVWQDLQLRLEALRLDLTEQPATFKQAR